jgi:hypothetical protein
LFLFGGFYDTLAEIRYFNDMWTLDFDTHQWKRVMFQPTGREKIEMSREEVESRLKTNRESGEGTGMIEN